MNSTGTFQAYIGSHQLHYLTPGTVGWIFSLHVALAFFCGGIVGPIFDAKGPRVLLLGGSALLVLSMILLGYCTGRVSNNLCEANFVRLTDLAPYSFVALHRRLWTPWRFGSCSNLRTCCFGYWTFLPRPPCKRHRHRRDWVLHWWHHNSVDAAGSFPKAGLRLGYADSGLHVHRLARGGQCPDPLPFTLQTLEESRNVA